MRGSKTLQHSVCSLGSGEDQYFMLSYLISRMCYKIITNIASLTSLGLRELLSLVQWLPVNFKIDYLITSGVLCRSEVSFGCLMIPLVQNCRSCLRRMFFFFIYFFAFFKRLIFFFPLK